MKKELKKLQFMSCGHFEWSGFMFKHPTNNDTYIVKLNEKMNLIEETYKWGKLVFDFWVLYRDKNMFLFTKMENLLDHPPVTSKIITNF